MRYSDDNETVLTGGRLSKGVVRVGETVRRPSTGASDFAVALLTHLASVGFTGAPRYLGRDSHGRDILSHIPGWVPAKFQTFTDQQISTAGRLLRAFHDATRGSALASSASVVCHHDAGPNNVVFQNGRPVAFIDFDMAAPGPALDDVGYMAWTWCVSSKSTRAPVAMQARQVGRLADAYGLQSGERAELVDAMLERQRRNVRFWRERLHRPDNMPDTPRAQIIERIAWSQRELEFTESNRLLFAQALS